MRRARGERGAIGGAEMLPLGVLVFVGGMLLVANAWAVLDARLMAAGAAREAVRAYVEAPDGPSAAAAGAAAARRAMEAQGADPGAMTLEWEVDGSGFGRCARVLAIVEVDVSAFALGGVGPVPVQAAASEVVDPFRDGVGGAGCGA